MPIASIRHLKQNQAERERHQERAAPSDSGPSTIPELRRAALRPSRAQGATLFVLLQPSPDSSMFGKPGRAVPLPIAVLSVTLEGQATEIPDKPLLLATLPISVLPSPVAIPKFTFWLALFQVTTPVASIPSPAWVSVPDTMLRVTIPSATIPVPMVRKTRKPSTIEPEAPVRSTPIKKREINPFRTAIPSLSPGLPTAAVIPVPEPLPLIEKPARSIVTPSVVITRQSPVAVRLFASRYEPG